MSDLYEKISHGDRRTIVRKYKAGDELSTTGTLPQTIVLKTDVAANVTQEYNAYSRTWRDVIINLKDMVETVTAGLPRPQPVPTSIPGCDHCAAVECDGPCPIWTVSSPWWKFW